MRKKVLKSLLALIFIFPAYALPYALLNDVRTYYIDDIWAEELFIEPVKKFVEDEFSRYGYRHTPDKDEATIRLHITIHSVKNRPQAVRPFVIWPITDKKRDIGEARISVRIIDNETNREMWANSIKGKHIENLLLAWVERPKRARMKAFEKALGLVFDPFFIHEMPIFD